MVFQGDRYSLIYEQRRVVHSPIKGTRFPEICFCCISSWRLGSRNQGNLGRLKAWSLRQSGKSDSSSDLAFNRTKLHQLLESTILVKSNGTLGLGQFHHSFPPPPIQGGWVSALKLSPLKQHCMGGWAKFGKKSRFYHRTGGDNENIANFQGVQSTLDQDCSP